MEKNKKLMAFVEDVTGALIAGHKYQVPGFGTFSTCSRKAKDGSILCTIAMFRVSAELRPFLLGGESPELSGEHTEAVSSIIKKIRVDNIAGVPNLGHFEVQKHNSENLKLVFVGSEGLNDALGN